MAEGYVLKEVQITLQPGVVVIAEVDTIDAIAKLLKDFQGKRLLDPAAAIDKGHQQVPFGQADSPERRIETGANIGDGKLSASRVLAFKDNVPELIATSGLSVTDAVLILLLSLEMGLRRSKTEYEAFKALYEAQNIKSGSPLAMRLTDLRNKGYIDKKLYLEEQCIRLTAKGQQKAIESLKSKLK